MLRFFRNKEKSPPVDQPAPERVRDERYADPATYDPFPVLKLRARDYGAGVDPSAEGYGFETPDRKIWAAGQCQWSRWPTLGVLSFKAVGVTHHRSDLIDPSFDPGRPILLVPEPDNPHDPKAISIRNWQSDKTAGYVKRGNTSRLRNLLRGHDFRVMALSYFRDQSGTREDLRIVIFRPERLIGGEHVPPHPPLD